MYADILIEHSYARKQGVLTYRIPDGLEVFEGQGVLVPFQRGQSAGVVLKTHTQKPPFKTRPIQEHLRDVELLPTWQIQLAHWMSEHYFCSIYDVIKLMLPRFVWRNPKQKRQLKQVPFDPQARIPELKQLTSEQETILEHFLKNKPSLSLIQGVTGSGKTELYKHMIAQCIQAGQQALVLVPEISLTPQLIHYFKDSFPSLTLKHSRLSQGQQAQTWRAIQSGEAKLLIGSRSALFSPFKNLGLIILDESHSWTYKQEQSPRYHAHKVAEKIHELTGAQVVYGSATPSLENRYRADQKQIHYYKLKERIGSTPLPKVQIVDMRKELQAQNFSILSYQLEQKIRSALEQKEQVLLFLNRRGSASSTVCRDCGQALECSACSSSLSFHARQFGRAQHLCHHCGRFESFDGKCPSCQSPRIRHFGIGTEKVELELQKLFPKAKIFRADKDSMGKKDSHKELHQQLRNDKIDILIGTEMISKGLDLPKLKLVGVLLADLGLHIPDFRAAERSFQLLTQVAGRAGRREEQGEVLIQSYNPEHAALKWTQTHDYDGFYEQEIRSREAHHYPPFQPILKLIVCEENPEKAKKNADRAYKALQKLNSENHYEISLAPALLHRKNKQYFWNLSVLGPRPSELLKQLPTAELETLRIDVDPLHMV